MGAQPRRRARSQADVVTEPPAPSLPLSPTAASILSPRGKSELHSRTCAGCCPAPEPRSARKTRGCVEGSATRNPPRGRAQSREREAQYCGSTTTVKSGLTPAARQGPSEVLTAMTSMRSASSRRSRGRVIQGGPPCQHEGGHPLERPREPRHARGIGECGDVPAEVPHPQPAEPLQRVDVDFAAQEVRADDLLGGTEPGRVLLDLGAQAQEDRFFQRQRFQQRGQLLRRGADVEQAAG